MMVAAPKGARKGESMGNWHKTGCVLCAQNCGLEMLVEDERIIRVRPDKANLRSKGYACRKGVNVSYHQYPADRLKEPLKRVGEKFESISWDQAIAEIAEKLQTLLDQSGPRCLAYMGGSAQGGHMEAAFGLSLIRALGSQYYYSSAGQEFSGSWWVFGRMLGKQYNIAIPDEHATCSGGLFPPGGHARGDTQRSSAKTEGGAGQCLQSPASLSRHPRL